MEGEMKIATPPSISHIATPCPLEQYKHQIKNIYRKKDKEDVGRKRRQKKRHIKRIMERLRETTKQKTNNIRGKIREEEKENVYKQNYVTRCPKCIQGTYVWGTIKDNIVLYLWEQYYQ